MKVNFAIVVSKSVHVLLDLDLSYFELIVCDYHMVSCGTSVKWKGAAVEDLLLSKNTVDRHWFVWLGLYAAFASVFWSVQQGAR